MVFFVLDTMVVRMFGGGFGSGTTLDQAGDVCGEDEDDFGEGLGGGGGGEATAG